MCKYEKLMTSLRAALKQELPQVDQIRRELEELPKHQIQNDSSLPLVIATVATDGGENRLVLEPIQVQIFRVVDSKGEKYFEDFIPLSLDVDQIYQYFFKSNELLQSFVRNLDIDWDDLLPQNSFQKSYLMGMMRELMEWAAILNLAQRPSNPMLIVRDGLLRSVAIPKRAFIALERTLINAAKTRGHIIVGVAKRSKLINYLSFAIAIDSSLPKGQAGYIEVPRELEVRATPSHYRWHQADRSMGNLLLARLTTNCRTIYPIEIPSWAADQTAQILASLSEDAQGSFPDPGYPQSLVKAHQFAHIGGMEIEILERMLRDEMKLLKPEFSDPLLTQMLLGKKLSLPLVNDEVI